MLFSKKLLLTILMISATSIYCIDYRKVCADTYSHIKNAGQRTVDNTWNLWGPAAFMFGGSYGFEFLSGRDSNFTIYDRLKASALILGITAGVDFIKNVIPVNKLNKLPKALQEVIASPYSSAAAGTGIYWLFYQMIK